MTVAAIFHQIIMMLTLGFFCEEDNSGYLGDDYEWEEIGDDDGDDRVRMMTLWGWWQDDDDDDDDRMMMTMMMARWGYMSAVYHNTDTCWLRRTFGLAARPKINLCDEDARTWKRQKYLELILFDLYLRKTASWKILTWTGPISPRVVLVQSSEEIIVQGALGPDWMELPRNVYSLLLPYHSYMDFWYKEYLQIFIKNRNVCRLA